MSLVGDIIMGTREQMTDLPQALPAPVVAVVTETTVGAGPVIFTAGQVVSYQFTQLTPWGESAPSAVATYTVVGASVYLTFGGTCSYNASALRVYFSTVTNGLLEQYFQITTTTQGTFVLTAGGTQSGFSLPPQRSSAWLPDTDGTAASASTLYRWLKEGLEALGIQTGGIRDVTGLPTSSGVAQYQVVHRWKKIDNVFYRGYPLEQGTKQMVFRHSPVTGLSGTVTVNTSAERQILEFWPQPDETAGIGTVTGALTTTSTSLTYTPGTSSFQLGFGVAILGTYPPTALTGPGSCEIVYFSGTGSGTQLLSLTRGLGGTIPQAWPIGTVVQEGLVYMTGLRFPTIYTVGQANLVLSLPAAWVDAVRVYMLYRFRDAEQDRNTAQSLLKEFEAKGKEMATQQQLAGPRRIQVGGGGGVEIASGFGSPFGGIIIP